MRSSMLQRHKLHPRAAMWSRDRHPFRRGRCKAGGRCNVSGVHPRPMESITSAVPGAERVSDLHRVSITVCPGWFGQG